jgi:hypothetical protein
MQRLKTHFPAFTVLECIAALACLVLLTMLTISLWKVGWATPRQENPIQTPTSSMTAPKGPVVER